MPYGIALNSSGRYEVTSPKGKTWKTTYASQEAAEKGVSYVQGRFGQTTTQEAPISSPEETIVEGGADTAAERARLGIPPKVTPDEDTEGW